MAFILRFDMLVIRDKLADEELMLEGAAKLVGLDTALCVNTLDCIRFVTFASS